MKIEKDISSIHDGVANTEAEDRQLGQLLSAALTDMDNLEGKPPSCLSIEDIALLSESGTRVKSVEERDLMMKHLSSCDTCYDIFMMTVDLQADQKPGKKTSVRAVFATFKPWALAASLLIAVFSIYVFYNNNDVPRTPAQLLESVESEAHIGEIVSIAKAKEEKVAEKNNDAFMDEKPEEKPTAKPDESRAVHSKDGRRYIGKGAETYRGKKEAPRKRIRPDDGYHMAANKAPLKLKKAAPKPKPYIIPPKSSRRTHSKPGVKKPMAQSNAMQQAQLDYMKKQQQTANETQSREHVQQQQMEIQQQDPALNTIASPRNRKRKYPDKVKKKVSVDDLEEADEETAEEKKSQRQQRQRPIPVQAAVQSERKDNVATAPLKTLFAEHISLVTLEKSPNISDFLAKSTPGSVEYYFFSLARSGWCTEQGSCYRQHEKITRWPKKQAKQLLARWQELLPQLSGIYKKVAQSTIRHLKESL